MSPKTPADSVRWGRSCCESCLSNGVAKQSQARHTAGCGVRQRGWGPGVPVNKINGPGGRLEGLGWKQTWTVPDGGSGFSKDTSKGGG